MASSGAWSLGRDGSFSVSLSSSMPKSKHSCWKLSSVYLGGAGKSDHGGGSERRGGGGRCCHGGVAILLLAELLEEGVFVDVDGRHFAAVGCSLTCRGPLGRIGWV